MDGNEDIFKDMPFRVTEAYKALRTNIVFALSTGENKAVVISSALPSEGKSNTSAYLAMVMAQTESRVVLIDADLRTPTQYQIFNCPNIKGLSSILAGLSHFDEVILRDVQPNLDVITSGSSPPNPSELLGSERMSDLLEELREEYEYIFIDTPPINLVSDAVILSSKVAGVVLVARHEKSTYNELTKAVSRLEFSGANILGIVVNAVKEKPGRFGRYGRYGYGYGKYSQDKR